MLKNLYSLIFTVLFTFLFISSSSAQFLDNFDSYTVPGQVACQNPTNWTTWSNAPCGPEDAAVSNAQSSSAPNSALIVTNNDFVKTFGSQTTGTWYASWNFYIASGRSGYFNLLAGFTPNPFAWGIEIYFNVGGGGSVNAGGTPGIATFNYTYDTWHFLQMVVNLGTDPVEFWLDGTMVGSWTWT